MKYRRLLFFVAALAFLVVGRPLCAQGADIIRGRVTGPDNLPIEGATITATSVVGGVNRQSKTNKDGRFTITFPNGDGDYFVSFFALGFAPKRFEVKRTADQDILVADLKMTEAAQKLGEVKVEGDRAKVNRNDRAPDIGGTEKNVNMSALAAAQQGDLAAMAASLPGVTLVPGADGDPSGFSVLGLTSDQNNTTLNGMNFGGSNLPRDAGVSSSLVTAPYDVSRGGFSGGQFSVRSNPGSNYNIRTMSLNIDAPQLQWTDPAATALGQQYYNTSLGGRLSGPLTFDHSFYNLSYQLGRRSNDLATLFNTDALGLQTSGIAKDSVARLASILNTLRIPGTVGRLPTNRLSDQGLVFGSFDFAPPSSTSGQALNVTLSGNWNKLTPVSSQLTSETPAHSGDMTNINGGIQMRHTNFYGFLFSETSLGVSGSHRYSEPYLALPNGSVLINSAFTDGTAGVKNIGIGGSAFLSTGSTTLSEAFQNQLSWFSVNNKHRIKLNTELRHDEYAQDNTTNRLGTFTFNSLSDLAAGIPTSFSRQLTPRVRNGSQLVGALSLGDSYKYSSDLQIQYGVRIDGNQYGQTPSLNPLIQQLYGAQNSSVPNRFYVSPRVGFSWTYGTAPQIAGFDGAVRGPRAVVRGGIGLFQNSLSTQLIGSAIDNTGLPGANQQVTCIGGASPSPDWGAYALNPGTIPTQCTDGSAGTVFSNRAPSVTMFAKDYNSQRSLRSNLQWNGPIFNNLFTTTIEATYSKNMNQPGAVDLNFNPVVRFTLPDEAGRPVYANASSIVPTTGAIASGDARVSSQFLRVSELRSDLTSESAQLSIRLSPSSFSTNFSWNLAYVYSNNREQYRGFTSTAGNPLNVQWGRSTFDSRHQIQYTVGYNFFDAVRVSWSGSFRSGSPYTPLIAGDVNGDGYANDRAFIYDPGHTADPNLANAMKTLLANASGSAKDCLLAQLGQLAGRNSCQGPWTTSAVMSFSFNPMKLRLPQRATLSFQIANPLGAADLLLHGENKLQGWGQTLLPDPSLLYVRGFDAATSRYKYDVNQRFGATSPQLSAIRAPVSITAMLKLDIGPTRERQTLVMQLDRGRTTSGNRLAEPMIKAIYGSGSIPNPMATILRQADTLKLTGKQADSVATMNRWYTIHLDSIWSPMAKYFAALPNGYNRDEVYARYTVARQSSVDLLMKLAPSMKALLTPAQQRMLPSFIAGYIDLRYLAAIRSGTAGTGFAGMIGGFDTGGGGSGERMQVIIH